MFTQRLYRSLGLAAHLGWARLLVDRYRDLVEGVGRSSRGWWAVRSEIKEGYSSSYVPLSSARAGTLPRSTMGSYIEDKV
jgi:hypothetical protein